MLKKILCISTLFTCFMTIVTPSFAKEPKNLDIIKGKLVKYHNSGEYQNDISKVVDKAMLYLKNRLAIESKKHTTKNFAIVLAIDETSLSNYKEMEEGNFCGNDLIINSKYNDSDPAIKPTLELYRYAKENHVAVFFISGRKEHTRDVTSKNLSDVGYKNWDGLILKPENYSEKSPTPYKIAAREKIEKDGYIILLNMGDQESDLTGKHAMKTFKLPNPYYLIP